MNVPEYELEFERYSLVQKLKSVDLPALVKRALAEPDVVAGCAAAEKTAEALVEELRPALTDAVEAANDEINQMVMSTVALGRFRRGLAASDRGPEEEVPFDKLAVVFLLAGVTAVLAAFLLMTVWWEGPSAAPSLIALAAAAPPAFLGLYLITTVVMDTPGFVSEQMGHWEALRAARGAWRNRTYAEQVLPLLRHRLNELTTPSFGTTLTVSSAPGLRDPHDMTRIIETASVKRFRDAVRRMSTGSIGLAGVRGVGKTTLMARYRQAGADAAVGPPLWVQVAAPVHYEAREFVLHLYSALCYEVLARLEGRATEGRREWLRFRRRSRIVAEVRRHALRLFRLTSAVTGVHLLVPQLWPLLRDLAVPLPVDFGHRALGLLDGPRAYCAVLVALVLLVDLVPFLVDMVRLFVVVVVRRVLNGLLKARKRSMEERSLLAYARYEIDQIRYLQTHTTGWSGKLAVPRLGLFGGADYSFNRSVQRVRQPLTQPEVVARMREFMTATVDVFTDQVTDKDPVLVIAVDELDKIDAADRAYAFVNEIKDVFGVPRCLFLLSVSKDAWASYERRGSPLRDAFDSAFSDMVLIDFLTLSDSRALLRRRVIGLSDPFLALCHCMSGGLPRDLIRTARVLTDQNGARSLGALARRLVTDELRAKSHAFQIEAARLDLDPGAAGVANELTRSLHSVVEAEELLAAAARVIGLVAEADSQHHLGWQAAAHLCFFATVLEVFTDELDEVTTALAMTEDGVGCFDHLARSRQQFAVDPVGALCTLQEFRSAWRLSLPSTGRRRRQPSRGSELLRRGVAGRWRVGGTGRRGGRGSR